MEAQDFNVRLGSETCISRVENPTGTLSSSLCQTLNKETVGLIPVIGVWLLTLSPALLELLKTYLHILLTDYGPRWQNVFSAYFFQIKQEQLLCLG